MKRRDGLGVILLPFDIGALALAVLCTVWSGVSRLWAPLVFIGSWLGWFIALLLLYVLFVWVMSLTVNMKKPVPPRNFPAYRRTVVYVIGLLCKFARLRIRTEGAEKIPDGRVLIVSNHRSNYDPIATVWALRRRDTAFITKPENLKIPIAGPMIYKANFLPIDRENPRRAMETIRAAAELLKNDVVSVGVYPEGTRSRGKEMLPFHNGVFKIAQKADAPIVVLSVSSTENIHKNFPLRRTDVLLRVCAVLKGDDLKQTTAEIGARVRGILEDSLSGREAVCV